MSDRPPILGPAHDPSPDLYEPRQVSDHCEAAKDLLLFLRNKGIRVQTVQVGAEGVNLVGVEDDFVTRRLNLSPRPTDAQLFEDEQ